jgi:hypothetical protein
LPNVTSFAPPHLRLRAAACIAAALLVPACATLEPGQRTRADPLAARVQDVIARRALGPDALSVIENIVRHEAQGPPPGSLPLLRELLAYPPAVSDAETLFVRTVPGALRRLVDEASQDAQPARSGNPIAIRDLLDPYLDELAKAQALLRSTPRGAQIDAQAILRELGSHVPSRAALQGVGAQVDQAALDRAGNMFLAATGRFLRSLRAAGDVAFPGKAVRFESAIGTISIGTRADDLHAPGAALIVDPRGNDVYDRVPTIAGAVSVIVDLEGDDRYQGSDAVVHGLSAIVDFSGSDRYAMTGPGLGAAIAGTSLILDFAGDDSYEAELFGEGAAAFGLGAIVDLSGNDRYVLRAGGQGLGLAGGIGLLWDRGGNDTYTARGLADVYDRGGGISGAQGAALGFRTMLGAGAGILRDESGDDVYEAEMFAQGMGFFYGLGLLWDGGGNDRYRAVRYAQGNGVHEAVGALRDESGSDRYELAFGVGQGMGLDLAVGVLWDGAGDDSYAARTHAQGSATANGIGILFDSGGADRWEMASDRLSWGHAEWFRGLPSVGLLLYEPAQAGFAREGKAVAPPEHSAELGGPLGGSPIAHEPVGKPQCPAVADSPKADDDPTPLAQALRSIVPGAGPGDPQIHACVRRRLTHDLRASLSVLPPDDFNVAYSLAEALRCAIAAAATEHLEAMWIEMENVLAREPATPFANAIAGALRERPAPAPQISRILRALDQHPRCSVRTAALSLRSANAGEAAYGELVQHAQNSLGSSCWRLQAAALETLRRIGIEPATETLPTFLRLLPTTGRPPGGADQTSLVRP